MVEDDMIWKVMRSWVCVAWCLVGRCVELLALLLHVCWDRTV